MFQVVSVYTVESSGCLPDVLDLLFEKCTAAYSTESFSCKKAEKSFKILITNSKKKSHHVMSSILFSSLFSLIFALNKFYSQKKEQQFMSNSQRI